MDYLNKIDTADALTYQGICEQLKQDIKTQVEDSTEQELAIIKPQVLQKSLTTTETLSN